MSLHLTLQGTLAPCFALCMFVCLRREKTETRLSTRRHVQQFPAVSRGALCFCLAGVREPHAGSGAVTLGTNGHTKASLHLCKRVIHVALPFLAAMLSTKNLQRDVSQDEQSASRVYRGCYKYYQLYMLVHIRTEILTLSERAGALAVAVL